MAKPTLAERLERFAKAARNASCSLELHHASRGRVAKLDETDSISGEDLYQRAVDHASAFHGKQGYRLKAIYPEGEEKEALDFKIDGSSSEDDAVPEQATERGVIQTLMRQNERLLTAVERGHKPLVDAIDRLGTMFDSVAKHMSAVFDAQMKIATLEREREQDARNADLAKLKVNQGFAVFGPLVTAIATKFLPGIVPSKALIMQFMASLDDGQKGQLLGILRPEQVALLQAQDFQAALDSLDGDQFERIRVILRPEQIAMLDSAADAAKAEAARANGAAKEQPS